MSKTLRNISYVAIGTLLAQALASSRSFFLAKLIEPADYGIWTAAQTIISLAPILSLGTVEALMKQVPYYRGKQDLAGVRKVEDSVFATIILAASALALVFLLGGRFLRFDFVQANLLVSQILAVTAAIAFFTGYYYYRCTAHENFRLVGAVDSLRSATNCAGILLFAWRWGLVGAALGYLVSEVINWLVVGFACGRAHGQVHTCFKFSLMADTVRIGFPITLTWWVYALHASVGRLASISFLGNAPTGYFGVASSIAMLFALVPNLIARVFYPKINAQVGASADLFRLRESVVLPTSAITLLLPLVQAAGCFLLPPLFNHFLPKYKDGLTCAQILIFGAFFVAMIRNGANYLIAVDMQMRLLKYVVISVLANVAASMLFIYFGWGINGIAVAGSLASALFASLIWRRVFLRLEYDRKSRLDLYSSFCLPLASTVLAVMVVHFGFNFLGMDSYFWLPLQVGLTLIICLTAFLFFPATRNQLKDLYSRFSRSLSAARIKGFSAE